MFSTEIRILLIWCICSSPLSAFLATAEFADTSTGAKNIAKLNFIARHISWSNPHKQRKYLSGRCVCSVTWLLVESRGKQFRNLHQGRASAWSNDLSCYEWLTRQKRYFCFALFWVFSTRIACKIWKHFCVNKRSLVCSFNETSQLRSLVINQWNRRVTVFT